MKPVFSRSAVGVIARLLLAAGLLLALASPPLPGPRSAIDVTVLVDDSLSMPREFNDQAWGEASRLSAALPAAARMHLLRFAADVVAEPFDPGAVALPRSSALDGHATNVAAALRSALHQLPGNRPAALLLVSDGAATHGDTGAALQELQRAAVPVYLMAPERQDGDRAPRLVDLQVPARVNRGDQVSLRAHLRGAAGGEVKLSLLVDGVPREGRGLTLPASGSATTAFDLRLERVGVAQLTVRIEGVRDTTLSPGKQLTRAVNVQGQAPLLYLAAAQGQSRLPERLRVAGLEVTDMEPAQLLARRGLLQRAGVIVLDDVAVAAMSDSAWQALADTVRQQGSGLLVLGGSASFGGGAYRHSRLEGLLPVTAEAAQPQERAAVLFLLDKSGSMGRRQGQPGRFALGRQAVAVTAQQLLGGDLLGITAFAEEVDIRLPLRAGSPGADAITQALRLTPGGGTRLAPALRSAAQQLRAVDVAQRLLVLVTDGFAAEEDLRPMAAALEQEGISVIALAVGSEPHLDTLEQLTRFNGGRILPVADVARLPRLMSAEVAARRAPRVAQPTVVLPLRQLPFMASQVDSWPALQGYMVSRLRDGADLYLQSGSGDPLLAAGFSGAGRVAVLPGGLGAWAANWWNWPRFDDFLPGLLRWLGRGHGDGGLWLEIDEKAGQLVFTVDQHEAEQWRIESPRLVLRKPDGALTELPVELQAPGRYRASHAATRTGLYLVTVHGHSQTVQAGFFRNATRELTAVENALARRQDWLQQGLIRRWSGIDRFTADLPRATVASRSPLLSLCALGYLWLLAWERGLLRGLRHRLSPRRLWSASRQGGDS